MKNTFDIRGDVTAIHLNYNENIIETLIDTEDLPKVSAYPFRWIVERKENGLYVMGRSTKINNRQRVWLHRVIMDTPEDLVVDHVDHYTLDNRKKNLRNVTQEENSANKKTDKYTGVHKSRDGYRVRLTVNGKRQSFGVYDHLDTAIRVARKIKEEGK